MKDSPARQFLSRSRELVDAVDAQLPAIERASEWFAESILAGRMVHVFGSGHSRIMVEEMWPRYGSFPGFNPIVELSLSFHNLVVGANGQRQAMYLENVPGLAERILRNFAIRPPRIPRSSSRPAAATSYPSKWRRDSGVAASASWRSSAGGMPRRAQSRHPDGLKLQDVADLVLDTGAPVGDAMVHIEGLETPVSPGSTDGRLPRRQLDQGSIAALASHAPVSRRKVLTARPSSWGPSAPPNVSSRPTMSTRDGWRSFTGNSNRTSNFQHPTSKVQRLEAQGPKPRVE